ncbi:RVT_3 domain-containing protein [Cephalotus follicularis]|uniref:RVT_3 domain-containing protein n=1 Tax=Cephalotus follicularis TaxID=3775 RepID=A0A1Q3CA57_CEPFO|nr:RVT_3 domain-containing protein [Cephalotus follicularis]
MVIRDETRNWVPGFSCFIGVCSSLQAELWGLRGGIKMAWSMHISKLIVETDSQLSILMIQVAATTFHLLSALIEDYRSLLSKPWECSMHHIFQEGNKCVDFITNLSH